jgi:hypothetical protein
VEEPTLSLLDEEEAETDNAGLFNGLLTASVLLELEPNTADVLNPEPTSEPATGFPACKAEIELRRISGRDLRTDTVTEEFEFEFEFEETVLALTAVLFFPSDDNKDRCANPPVLFRLGTELTEPPPEPDFFVTEPESEAFRASTLFLVETEPIEAVFTASEDDFFFSDSDGTSISIHRKFQNLKKIKNRNKIKRSKKQVIKQCR